MVHYVKVSLGTEIINLPVEEDNTLLLSTLRAQFPGVSGLTFKSDSQVYGLKLHEGRIYPPGDEWGEKLFECAPTKNFTKTEDEAAAEPGKFNEFCMPNDNELKNMMRKMKKLRREMKRQKNENQDLRGRIQILQREISILQLGEVATLVEGCLKSSPERYVKFLNKFKYTKEQVQDLIDFPKRKRALVAHMYKYRPQVVRIPTHDETKQIVIKGKFLKTDEDQYENF